MVFLRNHHIDAQYKHFSESVHKFPVESCGFESLVEDLVVFFEGWLINLLPIECQENDPYSWESNNPNDEHWHSKTKDELFMNFFPTNYFEI